MRTWHTLARATFAALLLASMTAAALGRALPAQWEGQGEPNHLEPVWPYWGDSIPELGVWERAVRKRLGVDVEARFVMLVRPSFEPEYVVTLCAEEVGEEGRRVPAKHALRYAIASASIYCAQQGELPATHPQAKAPETAQTNQSEGDEAGNGKAETAAGKNEGAETGGAQQTQPPDLSDQVTVSALTVEFSAALGARVVAASRRLLLRTRYADGVTSGLDGTTYEFMSDFKCGTTWSPRRRSGPLLMVEVGESLIAYARAEPAARPAALEAVEARVAALEAWLDATR